MKKSQLRQIIKEEISRTINEIGGDVEEEIKEYIFGKLKEVEDQDGPKKAKEIIEFLIQILQMNLKDLKTRS
jgi:hypothetical protein